MQSQLEGVSERCQVTERQLEKARVELKDIETILHNNQDEMSSLHEQLTEVRGQGSKVEVGSDIDRRGQI